MSREIKGLDPLVKTLVDEPAVRGADLAIWRDGLTADQAYAIGLPVGRMAVQVVLTALVEMGKIMPGEIDQVEYTAKVNEISIRTQQVTNGQSPYQ
jgi:hypothetical protein